MQFKLLRECAEVTTVQEDVQQVKLFQVTMFYARNLHLEVGNKCFELDKSYGFEHEQQLALQDDWNERVMYQKLCHVVMKLDMSVKGNAKGETQARNAPFGKNLILTSK